MATVTKMSATTQPQNEANWRISSEAFDLLRCFMSGIDDLIVHIALVNARKNGKADESGRVRLDAVDIENAANFVLDKIIEQPSTLPELKDELEAMRGCLKIKCDSMKAG